MEITEGRVSVSVEEASGSGSGAAAGVFFNPDQELNRDVTVAALRTYRERERPSGAERGTPSYLDAMTASGIRGCRAAAEGFDVTMADVDDEAVALARDNLARNDLDADVVGEDANAVLHRRGRSFDVTDLDPFGTPTPFADAAFANTRDLVCVTATDTAPLCGAHFESGVRKYDAIPRNTEYHPEMGLRVLLSMLVRTAARYDVAARPVLSHVSDHYARTYLALDHGASVANQALEGLGWTYHCQQCLHRSFERGRVPDAPDECAHCGGDQVLVAGPVYLDRPHDPDFVAAVRGNLDDTMGARKRATRLLERIEGELDAPMHYDQHKLYKRWSEPAIGMDDFLEALREAGYEASRAHYGGTTFKTHASVAEIRDAVLDRSE
ncbi:tRNA (guanine(26)-N(2))-dimethyltransferase [Halocalculus aciditolerans]|uniref:tRNA (guanine(26)-N(2))-dimethyltransferase n=1 Tax=Halocalculus aciditolerans TaxID=1383812 RepID=A0A830F7X3_9EURY|nr:tRNA (guanine(26)-N(2))-dimethyltransferase [Halocalculus aciditolerans]GGL48702.1 tRNA (guanine(10)-N(2))-dimethyltransferase [Halocalculus aciditolerans]